MEKEQEKRLLNQLKDVNTMTNTIKKIVDSELKNELLYKMHQKIERIEKDLKILLDL